MVIVFIVVLAEAFAWGYFGSTFTPNNPYLGAGIVSLIVFCIFYFFDRTVISHDMMTSKHQFTLNGEFYHPSLWQKYQGTLLLVGRLGMAVLSLVLSSFYLTQLVFYSDIEKQKQVQYQESIEKAKVETLGKLEQKIIAQQTHVQSIHDKLQNEIGGKKGSKYGKGPVAQSIQAELDSANGELDSLKKALETTRTTLENAIIQNDEQVLKNFDILIVKDSPVFRENAIEKLKKEPAFQRTQRNVEGLLGLFIIILISMKLAQPKALKLYYSSLLQAKWQSYLKGNFDDYLPESEKSIYLADILMAEEFERIAIRYANTKGERDNDDLQRKQQEKEQQKKAERLKVEQEAQAQRLKESEQAHAEREAREAQNYTYRAKVINDKKRSIDNALQQAHSRKQQFFQENQEKKQQLIEQENQLTENLFETERFFQSKQEDFDAREKRINDAKDKLNELQTLANEQEQKENFSPERVKAYTIAQLAVEKQRQTIKNMHDDFLTFERDMNIHQQKIDKLKQELQQVRNEINRLTNMENVLNETIAKLEMEQVKMLAELVDDNPHIKGQEIEIPFIAEQFKNNGSYVYHYYKNDTQQD